MCHGPRAVGPAKPCSGRYTSSHNPRRAPRYEVECPQSLKEFLCAELIIVILLYGASSPNGQISRALSQGLGVRHRDSSMGPQVHKTGQEGPKKRPRGPNRPPRRPKSVPRRPRWPQDGPRGPQDDPRGLQEDPPEGPTSRNINVSRVLFYRLHSRFLSVSNDQKQIERPQRSLKTASEAVKRAPRTAKRASRMPEGPPNGPRWPQ